jgi:hypothetical protein
VDLVMVLSSRVRRGGRPPSELGKRLADHCVQRGGRIGVQPVIQRGPDRAIARRRPAVGTGHAGGCCSRPVPARTAAPMWGARGLPGVLRLLVLIRGEPAKLALDAARVVPAVDPADQVKLSFLAGAVAGAVDAWLADRDRPGPASGIDGGRSRSTARRCARPNRRPAGPPAGRDGPRHPRRARPTPRRRRAGRGAGVRPAAGQPRPTGAVVTADALQTHCDAAEFLVAGTQAHDPFTVKANQPTLPEPPRPPGTAQRPRAGPHPRSRPRPGRAAHPQGLGRWVRVPARHPGPPGHPQDPWTRLRCAAPGTTACPLIMGFSDQDALSAGARPVGLPNQCRPPVMRSGPAGDVHG